MTAEEQVADELVDVASQLVGTVRDYGPDEVAALLDPLSLGHLYRLTIVLAAMVNPDASPADLAGWVTAGPVESRPFEPGALRSDKDARECPDCGDRYRSSHLARHRRTHVSAVA